MRRSFLRQFQTRLRKFIKDDFRIVFLPQVVTKKTSQLNEHVAQSVEHLTFN